MLCPITFSIPFLLPPRDLVTLKSLASKAINLADGEANKASPPAAQPRRFTRLPHPGDAVHVFPGCSHCFPALFPLLCPTPAVSNRWGLSLAPWEERPDRVVCLQQPLSLRPPGRSSVFLPVLPPSPPAVRAVGTCLTLFTPPKCSKKKPRSSVPGMTQTLLVGCRRGHCRAGDQRAAAGFTPAGGGAGRSGDVGKRRGHGHRLHGGCPGLGAPMGSFVVRLQWDHLTFLWCLENPGSPEL